MGFNAARAAIALPACDYIDQTARHARLFAQHADDEAAERRQFGWFQHHAIARADRRGDLPAAGEQRRVPRGDLRDDADGFVAGVVQMRAGHRDHVAGDLVAPAGVVFEHLRHAPRLAAGVADGAPGRDAFKLGQGRGMGADLAPDLEHDAPPLG